MSKGNWLEDRNPLVYLLLAGLLLFTIFTVMGCTEAVGGDNYGYKLTIRELPATRVYMVGVRDFEIKTERGWYFTSLHAEPGLLDGTYYNNRSSVSGNKGVSGTFRITVINIPEDAEYVTLKYQYCKSDKCIRSKMKIPVERRAR